MTIQQEVMPVRQDVRQSTLHKGVRYLLVEEHDREALLVWVGNEAGPLGETSVWVSSDGVIFRSVQGRLVGVSEPGRLWRLASETPAWQSNASHFEQINDEQPGFRLGRLRSIERMALPPHAQPMTWAQGTRGLHWVEEVDSASGQRLALYAMNDRQETIAGQRCITPEWCLRWQTWPAATSTTP